MSLVHFLLRHICQCAKFSSFLRRIFITSGFFVAKINGTLSLCICRTFALPFYVRTAVLSLYSFSVSHSQPLSHTLYLPPHSMLPVQRLTQTVHPEIATAPFNSPPLNGPLQHLTYTTPPAMSVLGPQHQMHFCISWVKIRTTTPNFSVEIAQVPTTALLYVSKTMVETTLVQQ